MNGSLSEIASADNKKSQNPGLCHRYQIETKPNFSCENYLKSGFDQNLQIWKQTTMTKCFPSKLSQPVKQILPWVCTLVLPPGTLRSKNCTSVPGIKNFKDEKNIGHLKVPGVGIRTQPRQIKFEMHDMSRSCHVVK